MAIRDIVQAAAGVGGENEYVEDVFSTYLYTGTGAAQTITNGIDLAGEGGLVWTKARNASGEDHFLADTDSPAPANSLYFIKTLTSNSTGAYAEPYRSITGWNSNGYGVERHLGFGGLNTTYASWTFRKAPKFFDVVTWTGNGVNGREIPHSLGSVPGCIFIKSTSNASAWIVYHRGLSVPTNRAIFLNTTSAEAAAGYFPTTPTSTGFYLNGNGYEVNTTGQTFVAYVFAHDAGGFGDDGEQDVISCGSYTDASNTGNPSQEINLGFEPQFLMVKTASRTSAWYVFDNMRGMSTQLGKFLQANTSDPEYSASGNYTWYPTATGFHAPGFFGAGEEVIYIAIRRPMKTPEAGTEVYKSVTYNGTNTAGQVISGVGFSPDWALTKSRNGTFHQTWFDRLRGGDRWLFSDATSAEGTVSGYGIRSFDMDGVTYGTTYGDWTNAAYTYVAHFLKRAPGFMDVVCFSGTGVAKTEAHNLGVVPELMILKCRSDPGRYWATYYGDPTKLLQLNDSVASATAPHWNNTAPTELVFSLGAQGQVNASPLTYVAYLFATLAGVSKVGSYTGTGANLNVDCGFSAGARFILIKRTDSTGDWYYWDSVRGIVAGNDPYLLLNTTAAEVTNTDYIDPLSSGFTVTSSAPAALNASGGTYIFLAIA